MGTTNKSTEANDYAIALYLNERVWKILWHVADLYPFYKKDLDKINRNYIFLVQQLSDIYANNEELKHLEPKPAWQRYRQIEANEVSIAELQDNRTGDTGQAHTAEVKRLCIIQEKEELDESDDQEAGTVQSAATDANNHRNKKSNRSKKHNSSRHSKKHWNHWSRNGR